MKRKFVLLISALLLVVFFSIFFLRAECPVEAAEPHQILETSRKRIEEAEPGQLIHIVYTTWVRPPPAGLEPEDPYHLSHANSWSTRETVGVWIEIGADGLITRWRTQVHSDEGELLQDLFFAEGIETDYFPRQGWASRFEEEVSRYEDERLVMIVPRVEGRSPRLRSGDSFARREGRGRLGQCRGRTYLVLSHLRRTGGASRDGRRIGLRSAGSPQRLSGCRLLDRK